MTRLPDELPSTLGRTSPSNGQQRPGILRLPDEPIAEPPSALAAAASISERSTPQSRRPSLSRLPEDPCALLAQAVQPRPPSAGMSRRPSHPSSGSSKKSDMRERFNKSLTVATGNLDPRFSGKAKFFRLMKQGETIEDHYDFAEEIYSGGSKGKVLVAKRRSDGAEVIVKIRVKKLNHGAE
eukprot:CAMPEP_0175478846 /NCGR_PEP_ID=MMETSP0095-20121207/77142_1 /TAXON_ID=311494 /ORGANISM="Alexandrium monilatum, Strain CCMP3105" /LENGTH=181 /DNA_ID=CAMNT_0016780455 /DNA_START=40 /DNA_END=582 /DNA_ORIENTATION=+